MRADEFAEKLTPFVAAATKTPGSSIIRCYDGNLQYLARSSYLQTPVDLPNFSVKTETASRWLTWLQDDPSDITITPKSNRLTLSTQNGSAASVALPSQDYEHNYLNAVEIVQQNIVDNDYKFVVSSRLWQSWQCRLGALLNDVDTLTALFTLTVNGEAVTLSVSSELGITKETYDVKDYHKYAYDSTHIYVQSSPKSEFTGKYAYEALALDVCSEGPVTVSYSLNTSKVLSPLMVEYSNGVKQVLAPSWI